MSIKQTMSITRALREIKLLDSQILNEINGLTLVSVYQNKYKGKELRTNSSHEEFSNKAKAGYDSVEGLIKRRSAIKAAILKSNAQTLVKVGNDVYTVAEAIEAKKSVELKRALYAKVLQELVDNKKQVLKAKVDIDKQIENMIQLNTGKDKKVDKDDYEKIALPFIEANEVKLLDPIGADSKVEKLRHEIDKFDADIDIVLSESNSKTEIEV
jgi:hypothetical protein